MERDPSGHTTADGYDLIAPAKLSLPQQGFVVTRPRLRALVGPLRHGGVATIVAGPGYGKTAFLVDTVLTNKWEAVYYGLDPADADPARLLRVFVEGVRMKRPGVGEEVLQVLAGAPEDRPPFVELAARFLRELGESGAGPLVLLVDDIHVLTSAEEAIGVLQAFLDFLPPEWRLFLSSRSAPPLQLERQFELGRVVEIPLRRLRMTPGEVARWAAQAWDIELSREDSRSLWRLTHGWPVALVLLGQQLLSTGARPQRQDLMRLLDKGQHLTAYLSKNFFASLDETTGEVLKKSVLLARVSFPRDAALFADPAAAEAEFAGLTNRGFLVTKTGPRTYTLHPLVRGFAERELQQEDPVRAMTERAKVATHLESVGELRAAASLYLSVGEVAAAGRVLRSLASASLNVSVDFTSKEWANYLPDEVLVGDPWLLIAKGRALQSLARCNDAEQYYKRALALGNESDDRLAVFQSLLSIAFCKYVTGQVESSIDYVCRAGEIADGKREKSEILAIKANLHFGTCDWDRAVEYMEGARLLREGDPDFDARIHIFKARLFQLRGRMATAVQWADKACAACEECTADVRASALHHAAFTLCHLGDYDGADVKNRAAQGIVRRRALGVLEAPLLMTEAAILLGMGERKRGLLTLKDAITQCAASGDIESELWAEDMLGDFFRRNLNPQKALQRHERSLAIAHERKLGPYERIRPLICLGQDLAVLGREDEATERLAEAIRLARRYGLEGLLVQALLYTGWLQARRGQEGPAGRTLQEAMRLADLQQNVHFFVLESSVALPLYALVHRLGQATWLSRQVIPRLEPRHRRFFEKLATGPLYPTDAGLGPPRRSRAVPDSEGGREGGFNEKLAALTARELEILRLIALGMPNKTIGKTLFITEKTVKTHTYHIFGKLEVTSRLQAALAFQQHGKVMGRSGHSGC